MIIPKKEITQEYLDKKLKVRFLPVANSKIFRNIIDTFRLSQKAVLDIGSSYGEYLALFGTGSVGFTVSEHEARVGQELKFDIRVFNIEEAAIPEEMKGKFDFIFANNIFEHMQSPHNFLLNIKGFLKPDGMLILGVPCIPRWRWLMYFKKFQGALSDAHINFFTRDTLIKDVEYAGWEVSAARGFRFYNYLVDALLNPIYPHIYVCAVVDDKWQISEARLKELEGYSK